MQEFTSWFAIYTGAIIAVLKLVDWLMLTPQRDWLRNYGERIWVWLDDIRISNLVEGFGSRKFAYRACLISHGLISVLFLGMLAYGLANGVSSETQHLPIVIGTAVSIGALFIGAAFLLRRPWHLAMHWYASKGRLWLLVVKTLASFFLLWLLTYFSLLQLVEYLTSDQSPPDGNDILSWRGPALNIFVALCFLFVYFFFIMFFIVYGSMILLVELWIAVWLARFVLLRVVEHDKGPVLGLAGLLIAIGALAKSFSQ